MGVRALRAIPNEEPSDEQVGPVGAALVGVEPARLEMVRQSITTATTLAHERTLPVDSALESMVPTGRVQRGSTLAVHGVGATSFALALAGEAVRNGSFLAVVAPPSFGLAACMDFGIPLRRVVQFVVGDNWSQAVGAIIEGFDIVLLADRQRVRASQARQLTARNRERGSVLLRVSSPPWPDAADLRFDIGTPAWSGLGQGHGHLQGRQVSVQVAGRRYHGGARSHSVMLPAMGGGVQAVVPARPAVERSTDQRVANQRFAGSDIDAFLDVVDRDDRVGLDRASSNRAASTDGDQGLDAIA